MDDVLLDFFIQIWHNNQRSGQNTQKAKDLFPKEQVFLFGVIINVHRSNPRSLPTKCYMEMQKKNP